MPFASLRRGSPPPRPAIIAALFVCCLLLSGSLVGHAEDYRPPYHHLDPQRFGIDLVALEHQELAKAAATNQADFDVTHYELNLFPDFEQKTLGGSVRIHFTSLVNGLDRIDLDLYDNMSVNSARHGNSLLVWSHANDILSLQLDQPLALGEAIDVLVSYEGTPLPVGFMGLQFLEHDGVPIVASLSEPYFARSWWPCKDVPTDKATVELTCLTPETYYCAGNGTLTNANNIPGLGTFYTWTETYPVSTYLVSIAATNYVGWNESYTAPGGQTMEIEYRVFPEDLPKALVDFENTIEMIDFYVSIFGQYPFIDEKYGMAEFVFDGAMEHNTMTSYGNVLITGDKFYERLVGHELAHHWWGNSVTVSDWEEVWLHEGFATYSEALWIEYKYGFDDYHQFMRQNSAYAVGFWGPVSPPTPLFGGTVYSKGAWVLHMLRHVIGDNDFFQILSQFAASPQLAYGNATIADFVALSESITGIDLDWFFDQWLYRVGRPDYRISWNAVEVGEQYQITLSLEQIQESELYLMPIDIVVDVEGGSESFVIWSSSAKQVTTLLVSGEPLDVRIDPDDWILRWNQTEDTVVSAPSMSRGQLQLLPNYPNPFNPRTILRFDLDNPSRVSLRILDPAGRVVKSFLPGLLSAGNHELSWNGRDDRGHSVASGVYTVQIRAGESGASQKITLLK